MTNTSIPKGTNNFIILITEMNLFLFNDLLTFVKIFLILRFFVLNKKKVKKMHINFSFSFFFFLSFLISARKASKSAPLVPGRRWSYQAPLLIVQISMTSTQPMTKCIKIWCGRTVNCIPDLLIFFSFEGKKFFPPVSHSFFFSLILFYFSSNIFL